MSLRYLTPILLSGVSIFFIGCQRSSELVYVDISLIRDNDIVAEGKAMASATSSFGAFQGLIRKRNATASGRQQTEDRREQALRLIQNQRETTLRELETTYLKEAMVDFGQFKKSIQSELSNQVSEFSNQIVETISEWTKQHAEDRSIMVVRMALIRGYPEQRTIPNKEIVLKYSVYEKELENEWKQLHSKLATIDDSFESKVQAYLKDNFRLSSELRDRVATLIRNELERIEVLAKKQAKDRLASTDRISIPKLLDSSAGVLPEIAGRVIVIPGMSVSLNSLVPIARINPTREVILKKLNIWLSLYGYKLASTKTNATDRTQEFKTWLKNN